VEELQLRVGVLEEEAERLRQEMVRLKETLVGLERRVLDPREMGEIYEAARIAGRLELEGREE
jgi:hypothetical protein